LIPATIARRKGRNFYDWWFFGAALFLVALPASLLIKPEQASEEMATGGIVEDKDGEWSGQRASSNQL
jgi:hypothetical protein